MKLKTKIQAQVKTITPNHTEKITPRKRKTKKIKDYVLIIYVSKGLNRLDNEFIVYQSYFQFLKAQEWKHKRPWITWQSKPNFNLYIHCSSNIWHPLNFGNTLALLDITHGFIWLHKISNGPVLRFEYHATTASSIRRAFSIFCWRKKIIKMPSMSMNKWDLVTMDVKGIDNSSVV